MHAGASHTAITTTTRKPASTNAPAQDCSSTEGPSTKEFTGQIMRDRANPQNGGFFFHNPTDNDGDKKRVLTVTYKDRNNRDFRLQYATKQTDNPAKSVNSYKISDVSLEGFTLAENTNTSIPMGDVAHELFKPFTEISGGMVKALVFTRDNCTLTIYLARIMSTGGGAKHLEPVGYKITGINPETNRPYEEEFNRNLLRMVCDSAQADQYLIEQDDTRGSPHTANIAFKDDAFECETIEGTADFFSLSKDPLDIEKRYGSDPAKQSHHALVVSEEGQIVEIVRTPDGKIERRNEIPQYKATTEGKTKIWQVTLEGSDIQVKHEAGKLMVLERGVVITDNTSCPHRWHRVNKNVVLFVDGRGSPFALQMVDDYLRVISINYETFNNYKYTKHPISFKTQTAQFVPTVETINILQGAPLTTSKTELFFTGNIGGFEIHEETPLVIRGTIEDGQFIPRVDPTTEVDSAVDLKGTIIGAQIKVKVEKTTDGYQLVLHDGTEEGKKSPIIVPMTFWGKQVVLGTRQEQAIQDIKSILRTSRVDDQPVTVPDEDFVPVTNPQQIIELRSLFTLAELDLARPDTFRQSGAHAKEFSVTFKNGLRLRLVKGQTETHTTFQIFSDPSAPLKLVVNPKS
ncbi:MAG TPA: hypothetical protein VJC18_01370, partial [bacterium]|nr:hypothetical protein [bacterium]